jgi:hypothetical protein
MTVCWGPPFTSAIHEEKAQMDNIKTEKGFYDKDNFVQIGDQLEELTVTITLGEYRNLLLNVARAELTIDQLYKEKEELGKKLEEAWNRVNDNG